MNPLKKFKEWYERRHPIVKGISIISLVFLFLVLCDGVMGSFPVLGKSFERTSVLFLIFGFITLFIIVSIHEILPKIVNVFLLCLLAIPFVVWGILLFVSIIVFWEGFLLLLIFVGIVFVTWKLKKRVEAVAWELEDQLKELKEQLGRGAITQEEYEQKRKKLEKS